VLLVEEGTEDTVLLGKAEVHCDSSPLKIASDGTRLITVSAMPAKPGLGHMAVRRKMDSDAVAAVAAFKDGEVVQDSGHPEVANAFAPR
jgi:hypothetical protein